MHIPFLSRLRKTPPAFDHENFIRLLHYYKEGRTTREEDRYIRAELQRNSDACMLMEDFRDTYGIDPILGRKRNRLAMASIAVIAILCAAGLLFAVGKNYRIVPIEQQNYHFRYKTLQELSGIIAREYRVKVIFDTPESASYHYTGMLDMNRPLSAFLEDVRNVSQVEYYYDVEGNLHFR